jgi:hypothetical protein
MALRKDLEELDSLVAQIKLAEKELARLSA